MARKIVRKTSRPADLQDAEAMFRLGICYEHGAGVPQDMVKAYSWFRKAASYGHEDALRYLSSFPPDKP